MAGKPIDTRGLVGYTCASIRAGLVPSPGTSLCAVQTFVASGAKRRLLNWTTDRKTSDKHGLLPQIFS